MLGHERVYVGGGRGLVCLPPEAVTLGHCIMALENLLPWLQALTSILVTLCVRAHTVKGDGAGVKV